VRILALGAALTIGIIAHSAVHSAVQGDAAIPADQGRPDLAAIFNNGNYQQVVDRFGTVSRTAFDASGQVIGTQIGTYRRGAPSGMTVEMTYLKPDAEHPHGQAFDDAGKPKPLH
jgi:hypothetical protein